MMEQQPVVFAVRVKIACACGATVFATERADIRRCSACGRQYQVQADIDVVEVKDVTRPGPRGVTAPNEAR